jgi:3-hexulose-6-phosphate synthase
LFKTLELGVRIAEATSCRDVWIEAGTPLIKKWGSLAVEALKKTTNCFIVADTKTMDTGGLEAEIMFNAGADAVTVLGLADNSTITKALEAARKHNGLLIVDLINHPEPVKRSLELDGMGVDVILYHVGIDVQRRRNMTISDLIDEIRDIHGKIKKAKIAVAGGIKHGKAKPLVEAGAEIIIVGGAITKADNPIESVKRFLEEIRS